MSDWAYTATGTALSTTTNSLGQLALSCEKTIEHIAWYSALDLFMLWWALGLVGVGFVWAYDTPHRSRDQARPVTFLVLLMAIGGPFTLIAGLFIQVHHKKGWTLGKFGE